jgi:hypothetical protein
VKVHAAEARVIHLVLADLLPERDHDHHVGFGQGFLVDIRRTDEVEAHLDGGLCDRRGREGSAPAGGAVGLRDHVGDVVTRFPQGAKGGDAELARAGKDDFEGVHDC